MDEYDIYKSLLQNSKNQKLSLLFPDFIYLTEKLSAKEMKKWAELEYNGYFESNPALDENATVPDYRSIPGIFKDIYDRPLIIEDPDLAFVNTIRIRHGISELEDFCEKKQQLSIVASGLNELINKHLKVQVHKFSFSSTSIKSVLNGIRTRLINNLISLESQFKNITDLNKNDLPIVDIDALHPKIVETSGELFNNGHYRQAILDTYIMLVESVKTKSGIYDIDNTPLMQRVFSRDKPILRVSKDPDEQLGFMWLFSGAVMGIRNPNSHKLIEHVDRQKTFELLCFASALLRVVDDAILKK